MRLTILLALSVLSVTAQVPATIDINSAQTTPLNSGFSGFNVVAVFPVEPFDYRFNGFASQLSPGWFRYPSGIFSDSFNWQTGLEVPAWVSEFQSQSYYDNLLTESIGWIAGKGGLQFSDAGNQAHFLGSKLIVCVNALTDTPESAGQMAAYAKANNIPVAIWEMSNEPYFFIPLFFKSGADYAAKMKPYRDAIKAADPDAIVALFFSDPVTANKNPNWDTSLASYSPPYWDAITFHHYPAQSTGAFSQWMQDENAVLVSQSSDYVTSHIAPLNPPATKVVNSEFNPTGDNGGTTTSLTNGTVYGAIYAAEYTMRMSTVSSVLYVGTHALGSTQGVWSTDQHYTDVENAYEHGTSINTVTLDFGFFITAQALGVSLLNGVLQDATELDSTTVTGGATVAATGLGQVPALYAQAYANGAGPLSVVITNKSAMSHQVTMNVNGTPASGALTLRYITASDPSTANTASNTTAISIQTLSSANPVPVPPYSVVRVDLAPAPALHVRDFVGNGRSDALLYDPASGTTYTALSNDDATYTYVYSLFTPNFDTLRTGDFNGDGKADIVVYNSHTALAYLGTSNGDGTFAFQSLFWSPGYDYVETGDLNGDGKTDFALYNSSTGTMYTAISNGGGSFTYKYTLVSKGFTFVRLADFNGDGKADIFLYNSASGAAFLGIGDGAGGFTFSPVSISPGYNLADSGDLNGDGKADLILYNSTTGNAATGISNGAGGFTFTPQLFSPGFTSVRLADYTGDGKADVTVYNLNNAAAYFGTGTGTGTFNFQSLFWSPGYDTVEPQDVSGDGLIDIILYNSSTGTEYTGINHVAGGFTYTYSLWGPGKLLAQ